MLSKKDQWRNKLILGRDFNDIRNPEEKKGERTRFEGSCKGFREFIQRMNMEEITFQGRGWTWANNWKEEATLR